MDLRKDLILRSWPDPQPAHIPILKAAGIQVVLLPEPNAPFSDACRAAGIETAPESSIKAHKVADLPAADPGTYVALSSGLWPGIARGPAKPNSPNDETASASSEPWIDADAFWVHYLKALYPRSSPVLAYQPNEDAGLKNGRVVGYETLEIAYAEARAAGGNYILTLEPGYRTALLKGDVQAKTAWAKLGVTAKWFAQNAALFAGPTQPIITQLVEPGDETAEFANLMFRRNASPALVSAATLPNPSPQILAMVATGIRPPQPATAAKLLAHAQQGATLVTDDPAAKAWWRVPGLKEIKKQEDRIFYSLGKGTVCAYLEPVLNPSEHALDVIDFVTHARRAVRIWNSFTVIARAQANGTVDLLNYATPTGPGAGRRRSGDGSEIQVRRQGLFTKAMLYQPGAEPRPLATAKRGSMTEVFVPVFERVAAISFS